MSSTPIALADMTEGIPVAGDLVYGFRSSEAGAARNRKIDVSDIVEVIEGLATQQMPIVSPGTAITTTTHNASDADAGRLISCTHASGCEVTFTDTGGNALTAGTSGGYLRGAGAGPISWAAGGTMVITTISTSSGHTETAAAPSRLFWHCVSASLVHVWGETA